MTTAGDPISAGRRVFLFARVPLALGIALSVVQVAGLATNRDAALLGAPATADAAPWTAAVPFVLAAALLPGLAILRHGVERGILLGLAGLGLHVLLAVAVLAQLGIVLPVLVPAGAWYLSQVLGLGWRPHADQSVRHILPVAQRRVFISYRRSSDEVTARLLKHELTARGFDVFLDVDDLGPSARFDERLLAEIAGRDNFVLLLSPGSLARCGDANDWLRLEVERALATRRRIVPVTRAGFDLGEAGELPASLAPLPLHNAVAYTSTHHGAVLDQLVRFLSTPASA